MEIRSKEREALSHIGSRWWGGPDPGWNVEVTVRLRVPTHRTTEDVMDLFRDLVEPLSGGYSYVTSAGPDRPAPPPGGGN